MAISVTLAALMLSLPTILAAVLPVYLVVVAGLFLKRIGTITPEIEPGLMKLVIHFLMPALILDKILGNPLVLDPSVVGWGIGLGVSIILVGFALSHLTGRCLRLAKGSGGRTFTLAGGVQNYGYVAIPILLALFDDGGQAVGLLFVHSLGVEIAIWTIGLMILSGKLIPDPKVFLNGPIIAVVTGLVFSYTGLWRFFEPAGPSFLGSTLREVISWLGACAFPIGLLLIGSSISDFLAHARPTLKIGIGASLVRLLIMPLLILTIARFAPLIPELKQVLVVQAAMPAAIFPIVIARHYQGKAEVAVQVVLVTSILALLTTPFWIRFGLSFVFPS